MSQMSTFLANGFNLWFPWKFYKIPTLGTDHFAEETEAGGLWWDPIPLDSLLSDIRLPLTLCHLRWVRPKDTDTQTGGQPLRAPLAAHYSRQEAKTARTPMTFIPKETRGARYQDHSFLCSQRVCQLNSCSGRKWPKWGESAWAQNPRPSKALSERLRAKRSFFRPNYLWIWYSFWYLDLNIKIKRHQLFEKCKCFSFFKISSLRTLSFHLILLLRSQYFPSSQILKV